LIKNRNKIIDSATAKSVDETEIIYFLFFLSQITSLFIGLFFIRE